jgi:cytochrome c2
MSGNLGPGDPPRLPLGVFASVSIALLILIAAGFLKEERRQWQTYQTRFRQMEVDRAASPEQRKVAAAVPASLEQIMVPELGVVDRCVSCHLGVEDPTYAGAEQPFAYHPDHEQHPFERFGCTVCHGGQGRATTVEGAHGNVEFWDRPLLPLGYIEASCGRCHDAADNPAAPELARGRSLFEDSGCLGCHKIDGSGGNVGPALDRPEHGEPRRPEWLKEHFIDPAAVVPGSAMPRYGFTDEEAHALTLHSLALRQPEVGGYHASRRILESAQRGERLFVDHGCTDCHKIGGQGGDVGPVLDDVASRRTEGWMVQHFRDPEAVTPGTMMPQFGFSAAEARSLVLFLRRIAEQPELAQRRFERSPEQRGELLYRRYGCRGCHGEGGVGGVPNPNAQSGEQVPALRYVKESYTEAELRKKITLGVTQVPRLDPEGPLPPLSMPYWGDRLTDAQVQDIMIYLFNLYPEEEALDW